MTAKISENQKFKQKSHWTNSDISLGAVRAILLRKPVLSRNKMAKALVKPTAAAATSTGIIIEYISGIALLLLLKIQFVFRRMGT